MQLYTPVPSFDGRSPIFDRDSTVTFVGQLTGLSRTLIECNSLYVETHRANCPELDAVQFRKAMTPFIATSVEAEAFQVTYNFESGM